MELDAVIEYELDPKWDPVNDVAFKEPVTVKPPDIVRLWLNKFIKEDVDANDAEVTELVIKYEAVRELVAQEDVAAKVTELVMKYDAVWAFMEDDAQLDVPKWDPVKEVAFKDPVTVNPPEMVRLWLNRFMYDEVDAKDADVTELVIK